MRVSDTIKSNSIAIMGMCKNAGKTTVLNSLIRDMDSMRMGLTSIGRDGEAVDVATITPKPDIYVHEGTVFATAAELLRYCDATLCILDTCGIYTPMGEVILVKTRSDGNIQIAGPSTVDGLVRVHKLMLSAGAKMCIFDGAINRKSLAVPALCEETILCSGASYSPSMRSTVEDTAFYAQLFSLELAEDSIAHEVKFFLESDCDIVELNTIADLKDSLKRDKRIKTARIHGAITDTVITAFTEAGVRNMRLVADDPSRMMISKKTLEKCYIRGIEFVVTNRPRLCAVTVNPFSAYGAGYDAMAFYEMTSRALEALGIPVFDVKQEK